MCRIQVFIFLYSILSTGLVFSQSTWSALIPLPDARQEMPAAAVDGKIYIAGGISESIATFATMKIYDVANDSWSSAMDMPATRHHHATATANGKVYILGGYETVLFNAQDEVFEYDPQNDSWTTKTPLPRAIGASAAVEFGGYIYFIGGKDANNVLGVNYRYDPVNDSWDSLAAMPTPREHHAAAVIDSLIYVVGGRGSPNASTRLEAYSPATNIWYTLADMPTGRGGLNAAVLNGKLYVMGGEGGGIHGEMEEYDPAANSWRSMQTMITPRHGIAAATVGNYIYVIGGAYQENFGPSDANEAFTISTTGLDEVRKESTVSFQRINDKLVASLTLPTAEKIRIRLYDISGRMLEQKSLSLPFGFSSVTFSDRNYRETIYLYEVRSATTNTSGKFAGEVIRPID